MTEIYNQLHEAISQKFPDTFLEGPKCDMVEISLNKIKYFVEFHKISKTLQVTKKIKNVWQNYDMLQFLKEFNSF